MARHTVRRSSSPSFWKVCAHSRLIANGKNEKFETTDAENVPDLSRNQLLVFPVSHPVFTVLIYSISIYSTVYS